MNDPYSQAREEMVREQLEARGVNDHRVLSAFLEVPRHEFVPAQVRQLSYRDCPQPIGFGQTISQPYMVASMTVAAHVRSGDKVLEVGTGSGYQAAILAALGAEVHTVERISDLSLRAQANAERAGYSNIHYHVGDGSLGLPAECPFASIIVTAGAPTLPEPLGEQLIEGGRLVVPIASSFAQVLCIYRRVGAELVKTVGSSCSFVPLIGKHGWAE